MRRDKVNYKMEEDEKWIWTWEKW